MQEYGYTIEQDNNYENRIRLNQSLIDVRDQCFPYAAATIHHASLAVIQARKNNLSDLAHENELPPLVGKSAYWDSHYKTIKDYVGDKLREVIGDVGFQDRLTQNIWDDAMVESLQRLQNDMHRTMTMTQSSH